MIDSVAAIASVSSGDGVIVAVSGGKDSVAALSVCCKHFARVEAYHLYAVPGVGFINRYLDYLERRFKVTIFRRPGPFFANHLREGLFRANCLNVPAITYREVEEDERRRTGIQWIASGIRKCDSLQRRGMLTSGGLVNPTQRKLYPLGDWSTAQVYNHLKKESIALSPEYRDFKGSWNYTLSGCCLAYIRRRWPDDYAQIKKYFPLVDAEADRWEAIHGEKEAARDFTGHRPSPRKPRRRPEPDPAPDLCDPASAPEDPQPGPVQSPGD